ncbi:Capsular associated protein [Rasamsonia emersonii CBS 393.64]|uniref:Capsular associated protein n=1 Tax=Rasamsonia emersonii (strain ATCC 16479 / CBS 393.64 / IMI 116815) TaxID=1408163 RepID=A0A0F4Z4Q7_RASE3|nr:Capsular associated protein [Rasamsonia emersonii CBS 393.64]KKA25076.1 Capsular associated protein [Rasamsonia emersonii CBS 393.64]
MAISKENVSRISVGVIFLSASYDTTFVFGEPFVAPIRHYGQADPLNRSSGAFGDSGSQTYVSIPLTETSERSTARTSFPDPPREKGTLNVKGIRVWTSWVLLAVSCFLLCIRVELFRQITLNNECSRPGYASGIPFLISLYDYVRHERSKTVKRDSGPVRTIFKPFRFLLRSSLRYVVPAALLMVSGLLVSSFHDGRNLTYICPIVTKLALRIRTFKILCLVLDTLLLICAAELLGTVRHSKLSRGREAPIEWGVGLLGVVVFWTIVGIVALIALPEHRAWMLSASSHYYRAVLAQSMFVTLLCATAIILIPRYGILGLSMSTAFVAIYLSLISIMLTGDHPFPNISVPLTITALVTLSASAALFVSANAISEDEPLVSSSATFWLLKAVFLLFGFGLIVACIQTNHPKLLPIDLLIYNGRSQHDLWLIQAKTSTNLEEAVLEYRHRYKQHPPPGFDKWYEYATSRSSLVIEDFDQIYSDLLPFRALTPQQLRKLTHELVTNPFNDVAAISIRNGTARVQEDIKPTHAWMVEAAAKMIEPFVEHLPDMDIPLNLNDEPRVVVPWEVMSQMKNEAKSVTALPEEDILNGWSIDRQAGWGPIEPVDQTPYSVFTDWAFTNIWDLVSRICPPSSKARTTRVWDRHNLCVSCVRPHSMGQFVSDWDLAADICHQPDLAHLHGFFISPSSFKASQQLVPLFSQSSVRGFGDILFPSPWNYVDKVEYAPSDEHPDPEYADKEDTLFWIGATTEGMSINGEWKGMTRQRFSHLMNNNTFSKVSMLMRPGKNQSYEYRIMDGTAPWKEFGLSTNVHIAEPPIRCVDCEVQEQELHTVGRMDFQDHWKYRYLFDMDGAGFSGRFHAFLQSYSLPFKTALFRQWFDSRITAWRHFVPQDLRLHDVWSTLAYFSGVSVEKDEETINLMVPHHTEGVWIAEEGRKWAQQALRKEDMEIYFFRLLLEWGRLTDDLRDQLGFKL